MERRRKGRESEKKEARISKAEAKRRSERELITRNRIANIFLTIPDEEMYAEVLKVILEVMESKFGVFGYIDEDGALVVPSMTRGIWWEQCNVPEKDIRFPRDTWGNSSWPRSIREKKTNHTNEPSTLVPKGHIPMARHISMPIVFRGDVIGLFQVANKETNYDEKDIELMENLVSQIAPPLNARLQRDREEKKRKRAEEELIEHRDRLEEMVEGRTAELRKTQEIMTQQAQEILEVSTPVMQVVEGVVVAPLIGTMDSQRTQQFMERLLNSIVDTKSQVALVDITGVPTIDTQTAQHLIEAITAARLLGTKVVLTGVRPAIAQTLVHLGIELSDVITRSSLVAGLRVALDIMDLEVVNKRKPVEE